MENKVMLQTKVAKLKERQAAQLQFRHNVKARRKVWHLRKEAALHDQIAYTEFARFIVDKREDDPTIVEDTKWILELQANLTRRVRVSSQRLIDTNQCHDLPSQLSTALNGLSLLGVTQPHVFFGQDRLCATYGRVIDELTALDRNKARKCLDAFDGQCQDLSRDRWQRQTMQEWIGAERDRVKGKPMQLIGLRR